MNYKTILYPLLIMSSVIAYHSVAHGGESPRSLDERLRNHDIELTESALAQALNDSNAEVRSLAALKLAQMKAVNTIPLIKDALEKDQNIQQNRLDMGLALSELGAKEGYETLREICSDLNARPTPRFYAAGYLLDLGRNDCLGDVIGILDSQVRIDRFNGLSLLPRFRNVSDADRQTILNVVSRYLNDDEAVVRIEAGATLAALGYHEGLSQLVRALQNEKDGSVRFRLDGDLRDLQRKLH